MLILQEDNRNKLIDRGKKGKQYVPSNQSLGKNRYQRRIHSKIANSVKEFNQIDMNKFFKDNILDVRIKVHGETDDYLVRISFGQILDILQEQVQKNNNKFELKVMIRTLLTAFRDNKNNIYISCSCPDWKYRFQYWATMNDINSGEAQNDNGKWIRNPDDSLGSACKHVLLVLSNSSWVTKLCSTISNYIKYIQQHYERLYADVIYPAVYGQEYQGDVQLQIDDVPELQSDKDIIDIANELGAKSTQFKKGNTYGMEYRFKPKPKVNPNQIKLDDTEQEQ